jgi:hypothetical protein
MGPVAMTPALAGISEKKEEVLLFLTKSDYSAQV